MMTYREIWLMGAAYAKTEGYTFTSECMANAAGDGSTKTYYNDSEVFAKIKSVPKYRNLINSWVSQYKASGQTSFSTGFEFQISDNADLYYSIQHCDIYGTVQSNGNMLIHIHDRYDFDAMRYGASLGNFGNNLGVVLQSIGTLSPFEFDIWGYEWAGTYTPPTPPTTGFSFPNNAKVVNDFLYVRDANGNIISGRQVDIGDNITVLDVSYSKQLVLVEYPTSSGVRSGYVTNATSCIQYYYQNQYANGSTSETVYDVNGGVLGSLDPWEHATPLYRRNGRLHVVYSTDKGTNTKSGYVVYNGGFTNF